MKTLFVAHRGAQQVAPENTLSAFRLAIRKGFKAVECDVQLTEDGHLVVIHDETVDRTTDGKGWISHLTWAEVERLTIQPSEHIPTLQEVVHEIVGKAKCRLIIEIKADSVFNSKRTAVYLAMFTKRLPKKYRPYLEVHSFWYEALREFKRASPTVFTAAIINGGFSGEQVVAIARETGSNGVSLGYEFLSPKIIAYCHKAHLFVDTWAIPDGTVLRRIRPFGMKAIVENFTGTIVR